jgi:hypothetical protein
MTDLPAATPDPAAGRIVPDVELLRQLRGQTGLKIGPAVLGSTIVAIAGLVGAAIRGGLISVVIAVVVALVGLVLVVALLLRRAWRQTVASERTGRPIVRGSLMDEAYRPDGLGRLEVLRSELSWATSADPNLRVTLGDPASTRCLVTQGRLFGSVLLVVQVDRRVGFYCGVPARKLVALLQRQGWNARFL